MRSLNSNQATAWMLSWLELSSVKPIRPLLFNSALLWFSWHWPNAASYATVANRFRVLPLKPHELGLQRLHLSQHFCSPDSCSMLVQLCLQHPRASPASRPKPFHVPVPQAHKPHSETYHATDPTPGTKLYILATFLIAVTKYRARRDWRKKRFTVWVLEAGKAGSAAWNCESN